MFETNYALEPKEPEDQSAFSIVERDTNQHGTQSTILLDGKIVQMPRLDLDFMAELQRLRTELRDEI